MYRKTAKLTRAADAKKGDQFGSHGKPGDATRISPGGHRLPVVVPGKQPQDVQEEAETASAGDAIVSHQSEARTPRREREQRLCVTKKSKKNRGFRQIYKWIEEMYGLTRSSIVWRRIVLRMKVTWQ